MGFILQAALLISDSCSLIQCPLSLLDRAHRAWSIIKLFLVHLAMLSCIDIIYACLSFFLSIL